MTTEPSVVYDIRDGFGELPSEFQLAYGAWLKDHGIDPMRTYRTEHHLIDAPFIRVFQHEVDDHGQQVWDDVRAGPRRPPPFDVLMRTPPPGPSTHT